MAPPATTATPPQVEPRRKSVPRAKTPAPPVPPTESPQEPAPPAASVTRAALANSSSEPVPTTAPAPATSTAPTLPVASPKEWLQAFTNPGVRDLFAHLAQHGIVTEDQAAKMLGGPRALRSFSKEFEAHVQKAPFSARIETVGGVKRYVREGPK